MMILQDNKKILGATKNLLLGSIAERANDSQIYTLMPLICTDFHDFQRIGTADLPHRLTPCDDDQIAVFNDTLGQQ